MLRLIIGLLVLLFVTTDCFRPECYEPGSYNECIVYFPGQLRIDSDIDLALTIFADNLQEVLRTKELTYFNTIMVRECSNPAYIKSKFNELNIFWTAENFNCYVDDTLTQCLGTSLGGEITIAWKGRISDTVFVHELQHWVDEICNVDIDWHHEREDWWDIDVDINKILKANGL